jgi:hypothetical protein
MFPQRSYGTSTRNAQVPIGYSIWHSRCRGPLPDISKHHWSRRAGTCGCMLSFSGLAYSGSSSSYFASTRYAATYGHGTFVKTVESLSEIPFPL